MPLRVYSVAKTVADCFKFRNQIGTNVALEALRDAWRSKKATADELLHHAKMGPGGQHHASLSGGGGAMQQSLRNNARWRVSPAPRHADYQPHQYGFICGIGVQVQDIIAKS